MPSVSEAQHKAMEAAAHGNSTLGIPISVGKEFVRADEGEKPDLTDHETAEAIRDGKLESPTQYGDFWLFDLRITGTGAAYRDTIDEYAFRDPEKWLSEEFVERCNGLAVIFEHPEGSGLNHKEFQDRSIGSIVLPYVKGDEVWGIAKIFDADAATLMQTTHRSTSPGVLPPKGSIPTSLENGKKVLDEGLPLVLDHLAVCEAGVWDKAGPPEGVRLDSLAAKEHMVDKEEREKLEKERDDAIRRADAAEAMMDKHRKDADEDGVFGKDKARRDAEETEREAIEKAEHEKIDKKRADRKKRHDSEKHDGAHMDCGRCDESEKEKDVEKAEKFGEKEHEAEEKAEKDKKGRKDGAPVENVDADQIEELKDKSLHDSRRIEKLEAALAEFTREQSPADKNALADAFLRYDSVYQMLGENAPRTMPGESSIAYRRRAADPLRKFTKNFKEQPIKDSVTGHLFDMAEKAIIEEAEAAAKDAAINDSAGRLREKITVAHGKTKVEFFGDSRAAWLPFMPPHNNFLKLLTPNRKGA